MEKYISNLGIYSLCGVYVQKIQEWKPKIPFSVVF